MVELESPFVKYCDAIDKKMMLQGASLDDYLALCFEIDENRVKFPNPNYIHDLLIKDFKFRAKFRGNIIMSVEGMQWTGKSLFSLYWAFVIGNIFEKPFRMDKELFAIPNDLDESLKKTPYRTTHFLDEQRKKNVGMGSVSVDLSLQDYEEQCRWTQKNIIYASPEIRDHKHYFVFQAQSMKRIENKIFCARCPAEIQNKCYKDQFTTTCPKEFIKENRGKKITFYERSGYPKSFTFLLKTSRKLDGASLVPRGFVTVPIVTPETVQAYDIIKGKNIQRLEKQEDEAFKYKRTVIDKFVDSYGDNCIKLTGGLTEKTFKVGSELVSKMIDSRKYSVVNNDVVEGYLYEYLKAQHRYTMREIKIMVSMIKEKLNAICFVKNRMLFESRQKQKP